MSAQLDAIIAAQAAEYEIDICDRGQNPCAQIDDSVFQLTLRRLWEFLEDPGTGGGGTPQQVIEDAIVAAYGTLQPDIVLTILQALQAYSNDLRTAVAAAIADNNYTVDSPQTPVNPSGPLVVGIRQDAAGSPVSADGDFHPFLFDSQGRLRVTTAGAGGGNTEYVEDTPNAGGQQGPYVLGLRQDADTSPVSATGDNHPFVFDANGNLKVNVKVSAGGTGLATEATLASFLAAFNAEDFATQATLSALLAAFTAEDFATETTLNAIGAILASIDAKDFATETTLATIQTILNGIAAEDFATETTLAAIQALVTSLDGKDFATQTTLSALLTAFNLVDFATETTSAAILAAVSGLSTTGLATEATLGSVDTTLTAFLAAFNAEDFATQTTLAALLAAFTSEDFATETTLAAILSAVSGLSTAGLATEVTLAALLTAFNNEDFATETTLAAVLAAVSALSTTGLATETTLAALLSAFNAEDFASETTSAAILTAIGNLPTSGLATQATLQALLTAFSAEDFSSETTLAALLAAFTAEDFATETTLAAILLALGGISTAGLATEVTLAALLAAFNAEDFATETTLASIDGTVTTIAGLDFATQTTLAALLAAFNAEDFATETTSAAILAALPALTAGLATEATLAAIGVNVAAIAAEDFATETTSQAILAAIFALPLGTLATEATLASLLAAFNAEDFATETTLATRLADATFTSRINTLGQKTSAASTPVVLASDQSPIPVTGAAAGTEYTEDTPVASPQDGPYILGRRQDAAGSPVSADGDNHPLVFGSSGGLKVDVISGSTSGTEYVEDTPNAGGQQGPYILGIRQDVGGSPVSADGDNHPFVFDSIGRLRVVTINEVREDDTAVAPQGGPYVLGRRIDDDITSPVSADLDIHPFVFNDIGRLKTAAQVTIPRSSNTDAFGRLRVSEPVSIFDAKFIYDDRPNEFNILVEGTGSVVVRSAPQSLMAIVSGVDLTQTQSIFQTKRYFNYQSGKSFLTLQSFNFFGGQGGSDKEVGYFDDNNGFILRLSDFAPQLVERSNVGGVFAENIIAQANWNIDPFDGTGPSGITLNLATTQILVIDFQWLGVGAVRMGFNINGILYYAHEFQHANLLAFPYTVTPNLPLRARVTTAPTAAASGLMAVYCMSVQVEAGQENLGFTREVDMETTSKAIGNNWEPLIGIRLAPGFERASVIPEAISAINQQNAPFAWRLWLNPTITGGPAAVYNAVPNSAIEFTVNETGTASDGIVLDGGYMSAQQRNIQKEFLSTFALSTSIDGTTTDVLYLCARKIGGGTDPFYGSITYRELA